MSVASVVQSMPGELQSPMLEFAAALEEKIHADLAVRREDIVELGAKVERLEAVQQQTVEQVNRLEAAIARLAEAQLRTEEQVRQLAEAQRRTEAQMERLTEAQRLADQRIAELAEAQRRTEEQVQQLTEAQRRTEERMDRLEQAMAELAEAQRRTEAQVQQLTEAQRLADQRIAELAEAQRRTEERMDRLEQAMAELAEAQRRTEEQVQQLTEAQRLADQRIAELAEAQRRTEAQVQQLTEAQRRTEETLRYHSKRLDGLIGDNLERKYRERAFSFFGPILWPVRNVPLEEALPGLEDRLTEKEYADLVELDVLLHGRARGVEGRPEVWIALEVSAKVDRKDVERAVRCAQLLTKAGMPVVPAVAGEAITEGASALAAERAALVLQDGRRLNWPQALEAALARQAGASTSSS